MVGVVLLDNGTFGWEAQILEHGELFDAKGGYRTRDDAIAWATQRMAGAHER